MSPEPVVTAWGGVLFLIHLLDAFDLPPGDPWGLLELVARGLLEHRPEGSPPEIEDDGIWSVLAELRGVDNPPSPAARTAIEARLPALRKRLLLALGRTGEADPVDGDPVDGDPVDGDPVERLLRLDARIRLTPTHVDLVTGLDEIWLPARRAGLDRDPGWRPDYSRIIHFHFL